MSRPFRAAAACTLFILSSIGPVVAQVVPRIPTMPVIPTPIPIAAPLTPLPIAAPLTPLPIVAPLTPIPVNIRPILQPPIPVDLTRSGSTLPTTTTPTLDLRSTLGNTGGSTPSVNANRHESDRNDRAPGQVSQSVSTYANPAMEVREAQDRGVALHLGGNPPPPDKDKDDDQEEGNKWWLWLLLVIGVLVVSSWMRKGK